MPARMKEKFDSDVKPKLKEQFGIKNALALPRLEKIVINCGMGRELEGTKIRPQVRDQVLKDLAQISGQKAVMVKSRKSVASFKVRSGYEAHAKVTLRGARMWEFFDRLFTLAIPRVKDFRGIKDTGFDKGGNFSFGVTEQGIFPEVNMAESVYNHGMNINLVFSNSDAEKSRFVLDELGVPFRKADQN